MTLKLAILVEEQTLLIIWICLQIIETIIILNQIEIGQCFNIGSQTTIFQSMTVHIKVKSAYQLMFLHVIFMGIFVNVPLLNFIFKFHFSLIKLSFLSLSLILSFFASLLVVDGPVHYITGFNFFSSRKLREIS